MLSRIIYSASSLKQQFFVSRHVASLWNNILIFEPTDLCSCYIVLLALLWILLSRTLYCEFCCQGHFIVNFIVKDTLLWILLSRIFYCEFCCQGHFIVHCVVKDILLWILLSMTFYCEFCCQGHFIVNFVVKDILL